MLVRNPAPVFLSSIHLRYATREDLLALEWNGELIHFRRLFQQTYQSVCQGNAMMWVVELTGNGVVGQLFVQLKSSRIKIADGKQCAYIYGFRIKPDFRSCGVGSCLLRTVEMSLIQRKFHLITLNVSQENRDARRFYERCGYKVITEEPGKWSYIDHKGNRQEVCEPAWRMQKHIE